MYTMHVVVDSASGRDLTAEGTQQWAAWVASRLNGEHGKGYCHVEAREH